MIPARYTESKMAADTFLRRIDHRPHSSSASRRIAGAAGLVRHYYVDNGAWRDVVERWDL